MRVVLFFALYFYSLHGFSQNLVNGKVVDLSGTALPGAKIEEIGTSNFAISDYDGLFEIKTLKKYSKISVSYIGYDSQNFLIENDTILTVQLSEFSYDTRWLAIGGNFEFLVKPTLRMIINMDLILVFTG